MYKQKDWVKGHELSNYLSVSERQIRKYISTINNEDKIIISSSQGYKIDKRKYDIYVSKQVCSPTDQENRHNYIMQKLLTHPEGYDIFDFSDELFVSEVTIKKDIYTIKSLISSYGLIITRNKNIIRLSGNEESLRKLMYSFISNYSFNTNFYQGGFYLFDMHYDFNEMQSKLKEILHQCHLECNDFALNNLTMHLIIILNRIENGYQLLESIQGENPLHFDSYQAANKMNDYFMEEYGIQLNESELINITLIITNNINRIGTINYDHLNLRNIHNYVDHKYIDITKDLIQKVEKNYYLLPFKESFISKFILHIQNLFFRTHNNFSVKNPLANTIKLTYPLIYDIAVFIAQELKQKYDLFLNEDEIAFISFHIGSYFEESSFSKISKVNCAFVYIHYYDFYKTSLNKIQERFQDRIVISKVISISDYIDELNTDIDLFILSTGSHLNLPQKTVYINPFLNKEDFDKLEEAIHEISLIKQRNELKDYILNFFDEKLFYKDPPFTDKQQTLLSMTSDLFNLGYTGKDFYDDVVNRESISSTAFHDIAVPHSFTAKSTHKSFISIALFKDGILWSENKVVHVVAMIGINDNSRRIFSRFFDQLINIFDDPTTISKLLSAQNFDDFFNIINNFFSSK